MTIQPTEFRSSQSSANKPWGIGLRLAGKYPGAVLDLSGRPELGYVVVDRIQIHADDRGKGFGRKLMEDLIDLCDERGWALALTPSDFAGASVPRLKKFYKSLGFVANSGKNKDFTTRETMIRPASDAMQKSA
jgi:GNAT superfamily N-acetyltransferase